MAHQINPLPEILDLVPFKEGVLDLELADRMRVVVHKCTGKMVITFL